MKESARLNEAQELTEVSPHPHQVIGHRVSQDMSEGDDHRVDSRQLEPFLEGYKGRHVCFHVAASHCVRVRVENAPCRLFCIVYGYSHNPSVHLPWKRPGVSGDKPYPYLWLDALTQKVREDGRIVNVSVVVATAVNGEGKREIIGMDVGTSEDGAFWLAFLRSLSARGLGGVELVVSDAHQGLRGAIAAVFGGAIWQRCRTHFMTNLLTRVPRRAQPWVATMVRTIYQQPSPDEVHAQLDRVTDQLQNRFPQVASLLDEAGPDVLAFSNFPLAHWKKIWSNNPQERLNKEIRRRTDVVGIFPNRPAVRRLVGAVLAEQHDEWAVLAVDTRHPRSTASTKLYRRRI